jgi:hypothetical protein
MAGSHDVTWTTDKLKNILKNKRRNKNKMNVLTLEEDQYKTVKVDGYDFKIRFISTKDDVLISRRRMDLQGGNSVEKCSQKDFDLYESIAIIDICTEIICPDKTKIPKGFGLNESCIDYPDTDMLFTLADEIRKHTANIKLELKKNKPIR